MDWHKKDGKRVHIWIELYGLDFKYWGVKSLNKIVGTIRMFLRLDRATMNRETLSFARMLVEVVVNQMFPDVVQFKNEKGCVVDRQCTIIANI